MRPRLGVWALRQLLGPWLFYQANSRAGTLSLGPSATGDVTVTGDCSDFSERDEACDEVIYMFCELPCVDSTQLGGVSCHRLEVPFVISKRGWLKLRGFLDIVQARNTRVLD